MKKELELKLVAKYPNLFRGYGGDMRQTCMHWGFSHREGWYSIIDYIGEQLVKLGVEDKVIADQVKEKFGSLRFYYHTQGLAEIEKEKVSLIIDTAEEESYKTCEDCGIKENVSMRGNSWVTTLCSNCWEKILKEKNNDSNG